MAINRNDITDVSSAKKLKYNNRDLTNEEKSIFDNLGTNPSLDLIKDTAELLETVILAEASSKFDSNLYVKLTDAKGGKKDSVKAINTNGGQFDQAVNSQLEKKGTDDPSDVPSSITEIEEKIKKLKVQMAGLDRMYNEEKKKIDDNIGVASTHQRNIRKLTEKKEKIEEFKNLLTEKYPNTDPTKDGVAPGKLKALNIAATTAATKALGVSNLKKIIDDSKANLDANEKYWRTNLRSYYGSKKGGQEYFTKGSLREFNREVFECFKKIGDDEMKRVINKNLSGSDKTKALTLWGDLFKTSEWGLINFSNDVASYDYELRYHNENYKGSFETNDVSFKIEDKNVYPEKYSLIPDGTTPAGADPLWPFATFSDVDFFEFMELLFPEITYNEDSLTFKSNNLTKDLDSFDFTVRFWGVGYDPTDGVTGEDLKRKKFSVTETVKRKTPTEAAIHLSASVLKNIKLRNVVGLYWDIYKGGRSNNSVIGVWDTEPDTESLSNNNSRLEINFIKGVRNTLKIDEDEISDDLLSSLTSKNLNFQYTYGYDGFYGEEYDNLEDDFSRMGKSGGGTAKELFSETRLGGNRGDWRDYIDVSVLDDEEIRIEDEISSEEIKRDQWKSLRKEWIERQASYLHQKSDKQHEVDELTKQLAILKTKDIDKLKTDFRNDYKTPLKEKTRPQINTMIITLKQIDELEKVRQKSEGKAEVGLVDDDLKAAKVVLDGLHDKLKEHEFVMQMFETYGKNSKERALNKSLDDKQLRDTYKKAFDEVAKLRVLSETEKDDLDAINKKLEGKLEDDKKDVPTGEELKKIFDFDVEATLVEKWAKVDDKTLSQSTIETHVGKYAKKINKVNFDALMAHLKDQGDGFKGENKDNYTDAGDDAKKDGVWKTFIEKGPKVVFETIVNHEFEALGTDDKTKKKDEIKGKDKIKLEDYGKDGEVDDDGVKKFMYEEKIGAEYSKVEEKKDDSPNEEEKGKSWWKFSKDNILRPSLTYGGITLAVIGLLAVIFWENISNWWNGPAEEQGENKTEEDEEEKENE